MLFYKSGGFLSEFGFSAIGVVKNRIIDNKRV